MILFEKWCKYIFPIIHLMQIQYKLNSNHNLPPFWSSSQLFWSYYFSYITSFFYPPSYSSFCFSSSILVLLVLLILWLHFLMCSMISCFCPSSYFSFNFEVWTFHWIFSTIFLCYTYRLNRLRRKFEQLFHWNVTLQLGVLKLPNLYYR